MNRNVLWKASAILVTLFTIFFLSRIYTRLSFFDGTEEIEIYENDTKLYDGPTIFFAWTAFNNETYNDLQMAATLEASCRTHKNSPHKIMVMVPVVDLTLTHPVWSQVRSVCRNFSLVPYNMTEDLMQFPKVWAWWQRNTKNLQYNHISDIARYFILYFRGGIYLDLDFLTTKPLSVLTHAVAWQESIILKYIHGDWPKINGAIIVAEKENQFIRACIDKLASLNNFDWEAAGPNLLTNVHKEFKNETIMNVLPARSFYPMFWRETDLFAAPVSDGNVTLLREEMAKTDSYGIHLWHKVSKDIYPSPGTFFHELLSTYSPKVLKAYLKMRPKR